MCNKCKDREWVIELNKAFMRELDKQSVQIVDLDIPSCSKCGAQQLIDGEREPDIGGYDE